MISKQFQKISHFIARFGNARFLKICFELCFSSFINYHFFPLFSPSHPSPPCLRPSHPSLPHASRPCLKPSPSSSPCLEPMPSLCLKPMPLFPSHQAWPSLSSMLQPRPRISELGPIWIPELGFEPTIFLKLPAQDLCRFFVFL